MLRVQVRCDGCMAESVCRSRCDRKCAIDRCSPFYEAAGIALEVLMIVLRERSLHRGGHDTFELPHGVCCPGCFASGVERATEFAPFLGLSKVAKFIEAAMRGGEV